MSIGTSMRAQGFTLLEVMIALVILAIAALGALAGLESASQNIKDGQIRQFKTALAEQRLQQLVLTDKSLITNGTFGAVTTCSTTTPDKVAIATPPWQFDGDFDVNALGSNPNGVLQPVAVAPANCSVAPSGSLCREIAIIQGTPPSGSPLACPASSPAKDAYTVWTRVIRVGDPSPASEPSLYAVVDRAVVFQ